MPSPLKPALDASAEISAVKLLRHLEWASDGFSLVFLFSDLSRSRAMSNWLKERLELDDRPLQIQEPPRTFETLPDAFVDYFIESLKGFSSGRGAVWLSLNEHPGNKAWDFARLQFLARLNERRFLLERDLARPLIIVLPSGFRPKASTVAPDIWHVRALSDELQAAPGAASRYEFSVQYQNTGYRSARLVFPNFDEWRRVVASGGANLPLSLAWKAMDELEDAGKYSEALQVADEALQLARARVDGDAANLIPIRDLAISLDHAGRVCNSAGNIARSAELHLESLHIWRAILKASGDESYARRDFSVALNHMAMVAVDQAQWNRAQQLNDEAIEVRRKIIEESRSARAVGDLASALRLRGFIFENKSELDSSSEAYKESLALFRQLVDEDPNDLRVLSNSASALDGLGRVHFLKGDLDEAERMGRESVALRRRLAVLDNDSPPALRLLSISLDALGNVVQERGDLLRAKDLYFESLAITRQLIGRIGETPESLRDLSVSLINVARVESELENWDDANNLFNQCLKIRRRLVLLRGNIGSQRDLAFVLDAMGMSLEQKGDLDGADVCYNEALAIIRGLAAQGDADPDILRSLSIAIDSAARVARERGEFAVAEELFRESLHLSRELLEKKGRSLSTLSDLANSMDNVAYVLGKLDRPAEARDLFLESVDIGFDLINRYDRTADLLERLSISLEGLGAAQRAMKDLQSARASFEKIVVIRRELAERFGATPTTLIDIAAALLLVASVTEYNDLLIDEAEQVLIRLLQADSQNTPAQAMMETLKHMRKKKPRRRAKK